MSRVKDRHQYKQTTVEKKTKDMLSKFLLELQTIRAYQEI